MIPSMHMMPSMHLMPSMYVSNALNIPDAINRDGCLSNVGGENAFPYSFGGHVKHLNRNTLGQSVYCTTTFMRGSLLYPSCPQRPIHIHSKHMYQCMPNMCSQYTQTPAVFWPNWRCQSPFLPIRCICSTSRSAYSSSLCTCTTLAWPQLGHFLYTYVHTYSRASFRTSA